MNSNERVKKLGIDEFIALTNFTEDELLPILNNQIKLFNPDGWMITECVVMDSSAFGTRTILPYGGSATFREIPSVPFSWKGLASDMSMPIAYLERSRE